MQTSCDLHSAGKIYIGVLQSAKFALSFLPPPFPCVSSFKKMVENEKTHCSNSENSVLLPLMLTVKKKVEHK